MTEMETLGVLDEIQALVSDHLQVVSYKWLSRNFLLSSNAAKRLLEEFVGKYGSGSGLEVVYTISGWLKSSPPSYSIRLVSGPKLAEAKEDFDGNYSIQVYSVQASVPKDPAALWNPEFVQAEELFRQPPTIDNCLRDNRFCGISNSFIKRNVDGTLVSVAAVQPKTAGTAEQSKNNSAHRNNTISEIKKNNMQQSSPKVSLPSPNTVKDFQGETDGSDRAIKSLDKEKSNPIPVSKTKGQDGKSSSSSGGSLANMWGRASAKSKPSSASAIDSNLASTSIASVEAKASTHDAAGGGRSDDDAEDVNFRRASNGDRNRKRRVVLDLSDDDELEDAVNLASPDPPKTKSCIDSNESKMVLITENSNLKFDEMRDDENVKEDKPIEKESNRSGNDGSVISKKVNPETSITEKTNTFVPENGVKEDKVADSKPSSPKRRKVLKTRIDERGREVTEVVWEGEETEAKKTENKTTPKADNKTTAKTDSNMTKKADIATSNPFNRPAATKKSAALGSTAPSNAGTKAGAKKGGNQKDPKQGNILSFFKKV